jgi:parvulin-like peptidyl-prolyl isomerase
MSTLDTTIASLPGAELSLGALLKQLHLWGQLRPLVLAALADRLVQEEARRAGLSVPADDLQAAADHFRRRHGLSAAADTHAWLAARGLSADDFAAGLEESLLAARLKQHLTGPQVEGHFAARRAGLEQLRLDLVLVPRDDLARELASQVRDEGRDLEDVAREHGLSVARHRGPRDALVGPLAEALASAKSGELVGPVGTAEGFALVVVEERRPAELDAATRKRIQDELFDSWLADRMKEASLDQGIVGTCG